MRTSRRVWFLALVLVVTMIGAACGDDGDDDAAPDGDAALPELPAGSTMQRIQDRGRLIVGVKFDQPGFGFKDPARGGDPEGFDVEIGKLIAKRIFGDDISNRVEFREARTPVRELMIQNDDIDIVVATYTINDARKQSVAFAGPYFVSQQDIMVRSDDDEIEGVEDLNGKRVCSVQGSTSLRNLQEQAPQADTSITFGTYSDCAAAMADGRVQAVTTDGHILDGLARESGGQFKVIGAPFSDEPYGVGLKKGDPDFRNFINDVLEDIAGSGEYREAFDATLGAEGVQYKDAPDVDRYTESGPVVPVTTTAQP